MENKQMQIPEGWEKVELKTILKYEQPYKYSVESTEYGKNGTPVLTAGKSFILGHTTETKGIYYNLPVIIFDDFTTDSKFVNFPFKVKSSAMKFLKEKQNGEISLKFLFEILNQLKLSSTGGDHKRRWISDFSKRKVLLPKSTTEQKKIAEILSKVDTAIEQTQNLIAKYQRIKTGLMQDLLTKGIDENGNIRSEETHEFKDSELGRIPKEWEVVPLNEFKDFITSGSRGWAKFYSVEGSNFIRITNLKRNQIEIDTQDMQYVNLPKRIEGTRSKLIEGDLLVSITADLGIIGIYSEDIGVSYINQHIALVRLDLSKVDSRFIGYFLSSEQGQLKINLLNDGGAKAGLNLKTVLSFPVIKVPKTEQALIVKRIENTEKHIDSLKLEANKYIQLKTGLMQDLLTGKKRVTNLIKEKAL